MSINDYIGQASFAKCVKMEKKTGCGFGERMRIFVTFNLTTHNPSRNYRWATLLFSFSVKYPLVLFPIA